MNDDLTGFADWPPERRNTYFAQASADHRERERAEAGAGQKSNGSMAPAFSDEALALLFAERHVGDLRFVAKWNTWLSWTGTQWRFDDTLHAFDLARQVIREAAATCNKTKTAAMIASAKTVAAVERLAKADRRLAATVDQWDADPWLFNTTNGMIDLRTGQIRPHRPDDYMTKITAVGPGGDCPLFLKFLDRITNGDTALVAYLRRVLGYAGTGDIREHALFFLLGTGSNGKSVLLSTVAGIFGDYHQTAQIETFTVTNTDRHPTEIAALCGARLVTATETEEGRRWAESRIKQLTGGDPVKARFMRQDEFTFKPTFKLGIAGNSAPRLRAVDEAIRRRFHLIPFTVTIPPQGSDSDMTEKLKAEWPGILQWLVEGCLEWQRNGLRPPRAVLKATAAYLEAEDAIAAWIEDRCERDPSAWESSTILYASWTSWAEQAGEHRATMRRFAQTLQSRGFHPEHRKHGRGFLGVRVMPISEPQPYWKKDDL
jgi:putative DNA primase/helicase